MYNDSRIKKFLYALLVMVVLLLVYQAKVYADTLSWDANPDATYYVVYSKLDGEPDSAYTKIDPGTVAAPFTATTFTIPTRNFNTTYVFSVKAFSPCGNSSDFSDPVRYNKCLTSIVSKTLGVKVTITPSGR